MASPERVPYAPPEGVEQRSEQVNIPEKVAEETGVTPIPAYPETLRRGNKVTAQSVAEQPGEVVINGAESIEELEKLKVGGPDDEKFWKKIFSIYKFKKAIKKGLQVVFRKQN